MTGVAGEALGDPAPESPAPESREGSNGASARRPVRLITVLIVLVLAAVAVGSMVVARNVVADQEQRLLDQRASEAGVLLTNLIEGVATSLSAVGSVADATDSDPGEFARRAGPLVATGQFQTVVLADRGDGMVVAAAGDELAAGDVLGEPQLEAVQRAGARLVSTGVFESGDARRIGLALGAPTAPEGTALYAEAIVQPQTQSAAPPGDPFSDLDIELYVGDEVDPDQLVIATADIPDDSPRRAVPVGAEEWTMLVDSRTSLVGSLASNMPWILLAAGLVVAVLVGGLVEVLGRRRDYALALVAERTTALRDSLEELEAARDQLVQKERLAAIGELASAVGHELRNPLGVLTNALYLLRTGLDDPSTLDAQHVGRRLGTAERELAAATLIVSDLLEFAREREPIRAPVDLAGLVDEVFSVAPPPDFVEVERSVPGELPSLDADRDQLRQVLLNLVVNAYDALAEGGRLAVSAQRDDGRIRLAVADSGTGMADDVRTRIFEPFFTGKVKGIGLGLTVSKRIVEAHGGSIEVVSEAGEGTTFTVSLPEAVPAETASAS